MVIPTKDGSLRIELFFLILIGFWIFSYESTFLDNKDAFVKEKKLENHPAGVRPLTIKSIIDFLETWT